MNSNSLSDRACRYRIRIYRARTQNMFFDAGETVNGVTPEHVVKYRYLNIFS